MVTVLEASLRQGFKALELPVTEMQVQQLLRYAELLLKQNEHMNLTAITEPEAVAELHFLDCAALLTIDSLNGPANWDGTLIDVGTGAGFPGVVLKILRPSLHVTLLDSQEKRVAWLRTVCDALELTDIAFVHGRGEELAHDPSYRERFDLATARAVAPLTLLCELCLPYVRPGGQLLAMKGPQAPAELLAAEPTLPVLGGGEGRLTRYTLPLTGAERTLVTVGKIGPTAAEFPRKWAKMKKSAR